MGGSFLNRMIAVRFSYFIVNDLSYIATRANYMTIMVVTFVVNIGVILVLKLLTFDALG